MRPELCNASIHLFLDQRDQGEKQRRKMTASGDAISLVVQNLRPGKQKIKILCFASHLWDVTSAEFLILKIHYPCRDSI